MQLTPHAVIIPFGGLTAAVDAEITDAAFGTIFSLRTYQLVNGEWVIPNLIIPGGDPINLIDNPVDPTSTALASAVRAAGGIDNYLAAREVTVNQELAMIFDSVKQVAANPTSPSAPAPATQVPDEVADYNAILAWLDSKRGSGGWSVDVRLGVPQLSK